MSAEDKSIDTRFWDGQRGKVSSRNGGWIVGKGVFCHGRDIMKDLVGNVSYFQFLVLNAVGRLPDRPFADWLEAVYICMSWPDPRIWFNQVGALGGTIRTSPIAATSAGLLTAFSRTYGPKTLLEGIQFIREAVDKRGQGLSARDIVREECARHGGKPNITGYARPVAKGDERIEEMERLSESLGFSVGRHLALGYEIEKVLQEDYTENMNMTGYVAAFLADQGFSPEEAVRICSVLVSSGITACYVDTLERPAGSFLPQRCDDMDYQGKPSRPVPED